MHTHAYIHDLLECYQKRCHVCLWSNTRPSPTMDFQHSSMFLRCPWDAPAGVCVHMCLWWEGGRDVTSSCDAPTPPPPPPSSPPPTSTTLPSSDLHPPCLLLCSCACVCVTVITQPGSCDCGGGGGVARRWRRAGARRRKWVTQSRTQQDENCLLRHPTWKPKPEEEAASNLSTLRQRL